MIGEAWRAVAARVGDATGITVSTDPSKLNPPCIVVEPPNVTAATAGAITCQSNVWLVSAQPANVANTGWLLDNLELVLDALGENTADPVAYQAGPNSTFPAYRITTTYLVRRTA